MADSAAGVPAPRSILRPFNFSTDAAFLPILIKSDYVNRIGSSNVLFLLHPTVVSLFVAASSVTLYFGAKLFFNHLVVPGEIETGYEWQDYMALFIYAVPPVAAVLGNLLAIAYWYHKRVWLRVAEREIRTVDLLDVQTYYKGDGSGKSSFWVLEYDKQIAACFGLDARNPGGEVQVMQDAEFPEEEAAIVEREVEMADDEDVRNLALFRHSGAAFTTEVENKAPIEQPLNSLYAREFVADELRPIGNNRVLPMLASISESSSDGNNNSCKGATLDKGSNVAQLRHLSISENFSKTPDVEGYVLKMAINAAFSSSTASSGPLDSLVFLVHPQLQKKLRAAALGNGFRIAGTVPLDSKSQTDDLKDAPRSWRIGKFFESLAERLWPVSFADEVLVLDRIRADKRLVGQ